MAGQIRGISDPCDFYQHLYEKIPRIVRTAELWSAGTQESRPLYGTAEYKSRGRLPHLLIQNAIYFITWRLADALPQNVIEDLIQMRKSLEADMGRSLNGMTRSSKQKIDTKIRKATEKYLDQGYGECRLRIPKCAEIVSSAFSYFDNERYRLLGWVVMPNHVHVIVRPFEGKALADIVYSWKSFTAKEINKELGRSGQVWQEEYYDRFIRNEEHLERGLFYVVNNPVNAGLKDWKWVGIG